MIHLAGGVVSAVLAAIAALHVYWAAGGRWGASTAVPQKRDGSTEHAFTPGKAATLAVALALSIAASLVAARSGLVAVPWVPAALLTAGTWGLGTVFLLRAVGDFKRVGFFKRVKGTPFARADSAFFSPLCLALALGCAAVASS